MRKFIYYAVFHYAEDGINISFPDLPGALSCAFSKSEAVAMAKEVLDLYLDGMDMNHLPPMTPLEKLKLTNHDSAVKITVHMRGKGTLLYSDQVIR